MGIVSLNMFEEGKGNQSKFRTFNKIQYSHNEMMCQDLRFKFSSRMSLWCLVLNDDGATDMGSWWTLANKYSRIDCDDAIVMMIGS